MQQTTVVIPTYNASHQLLVTNISTILSTTNEDIKEILVIDDGSEIPIENTTIPSLSSKVRIIRQENRGAGGARNTGIEASTTDMIAFVDSDCVVDTSWGYHMTNALSTTEYVGVGGQVKTHKQNNIISWYGEAKGLLRTPKMKKTGSMVCVITANCGFLKEALLAVDGFHEGKNTDGSFITEDLDITYKLQEKGYGDALGYCDEAVVYHAHRSTLSDLIKQHYYYGYGSVHHCHLRGRDFSELGMYIPTLLNSLREIPRHAGKISRLATQENRERFGALHTYLTFPAIDFVRRMATQYGRYHGYKIDIT